jgi:hypothetical protein
MALQDDRDDQPATTSPPVRRLPWPAVALGTMAFLVLLLAAALWSDRNLRGRLGPDVTPAPTANPPTSAPVAVVLTPTLAPTAIPQALPASTQPPTPTVAWWNLRSEVPPDLRDEIWSAYLNYWQVVADGYKAVSASEFEDVMAGNELERAEKAINELNATGKAQDINVQHRAQIVYGTKDRAVVNDEYTSLSHFVDLSSGLDIPSDNPPFVQQISILLKRLDGKWKVTDALRYN